MFVKLDDNEIELLIVSIEHCIATCKHQIKDGECEDCKVLRKIYKKLKGRL